MQINFHQEGKWKLTDKETIFFMEQASREAQVMRTIQGRLRGVSLLMVKATEGIQNFVTKNLHSQRIRIDMRKR